MKRDQAHARVKKSKIDDFQNKDRGTKGFFQRLAQNRKRTSITAIANAQGQLFANKEAILHETQRYFQSLYQNQTTQPEAQTTFLQLINQRLDPADNELMKPITKELHCTISQLATGKSPGPDGITVEFYKKNWTLIAQQFTDAINEIHLHSHIPKEMKLGSIILIHKKHDTRLLKNYRPISLLNTDLKIYTKLLANRLKLLLPKILHQHQYARPEGQIHQVLTLLRDMFQHSSSRKSNHFYLSLDFEKAFDSVDHQWLLKVLTKYGFTHKFVDTIATLHTEATSEILVNGFRTPTFTIRRGVRQGDPLTLFLFLIAVEPFLTAIRHNNNISGIQTPGRFKIKALSYADDITMTVTNTSSVTHVFSTLQQLEAASGLKLNYSKTHG